MYVLNAGSYLVGKARADHLLSLEAQLPLDVLIYIEEIIFGQKLLLTLLPIYALLELIAQSLCNIYLLLILYIELEVIVVRVAEHSQYVCYAKEGYLDLSSWSRIVLASRKPSHDTCGLRLREVTPTSIYLIDEAVLPIPITNLKWTRRCG